MFFCYLDLRDFHLYPYCYILQIGRVFLPFHSSPPEQFLLSWSCLTIRKSGYYAKVVLICFCHRSKLHSHRWYSDRKHIPIEFLFHALEQWWPIRFWHCIMCNLRISNLQLHRHNRQLLRYSILLHNDGIRCFPESSMYLGKSGICNYEKLCGHPLSS